MEVIRIPNRFQKQLTRISKEDRLWIFDSLMFLSVGENVETKDSLAGDILELIWREAILMEKKNGKAGLEGIGELLGRPCAGDPPGISTPKVKESKVKESKSMRENLKFEEVASRIKKIEGQEGRYKTKLLILQTLFDTGMKFSEDVANGMDAWIEQLLDEQKSLGMSIEIIKAKLNAMRDWCEREKKQSGKLLLRNFLTPKK